MNGLTRSPLLLQSTTSRALSKLLPGLRSDLRSAGVWLGASRDVSPHAADLDLELHHHAVESFYIALVSSGLHLSHATHTALASLCTWDPPFTGLSIHLLLEVRRSLSGSDGTVCAISA